MPKASATREVANNEAAAALIPRNSRLCISVVDQKSFIDGERPDPVADACLFRGLPELLQGPARRLVRQVKRGIVHWDEHAPLGLDEGSHGLLRVLVIRLHYPSRLVRTNADDEVVDLWKQLTDLP